VRKHSAGADSCKLRKTWENGVKRCKRCHVNRGSVDTSHRLLLLRFYTVLCFLRTFLHAVKLFTVCAYLPGTVSTPCYTVLHRFYWFYLDKELSTFTVYVFYGVFWCFTRVSVFICFLPCFLYPCTHPRIHPLTLCLAQRGCFISYITQCGNSASVQCGNSVSVGTVR